MPEKAPIQVTWQLYSSKSVRQVLPAESVIIWFHVFHSCVMQKVKSCDRPEGRAPWWLWKKKKTVDRHCVSYHSRKQNCMCWHLSYTYCIWNVAIRHQGVCVSNRGTCQVPIKIQSLTSSAFNILSSLAMLQEGTLVVSWPHKLILAHLGFKASEQLAKLLTLGNKVQVAAEGWVPYSPC